MSEDHRKLTRSEIPAFVRKLAAEEPQVVESLGPLLGSDASEWIIEEVDVVDEPAAPKAEVGARLRPEEEILRTLSTIVEPGSVFEIRGLARRRIYSGYFDSSDPKNLRTAAWEALRIEAECEGVYVTMNPVNTSLIARSANRISACARHTTTDGDIVKRRWMLIDFDAVRPAGISSTDEEHEMAIQHATQAARRLVAGGWPRPILADSGNGAHLLLRVDLPNEPGATVLVERALAGLVEHFPGSGVAVDRKVGNASRIVRLYGTLARKGDDVPERPHRRSRICFVPPEVAP